MRRTLALALLALPFLVTALDNTMARTPIMGWTTRYVSGKSCTYNETFLESVAEALGFSDLVSIGYVYLVLHDCAVSSRTSAGVPIEDAARFPGGIERLSNALSSRQMMLGIGTDAGPTTCLGSVGSKGYENVDADAFARWGATLVTVGTCSGSSREELQKISAAVVSTGTPTVFMFDNNGTDNAPLWGSSIANAWTTSKQMVHPDVSYKTIMEVFDRNAQFFQYAGPGGWNDPGYLLVGIPENEKNGITAKEEKLQFLLWAISSAPLMLAANPSDMDWQDFLLVANREVIAINQDELGNQAQRIYDDGKGHQIWAKRLLYCDTSKCDPNVVDVAVALLNRDGTDADMYLTWDMIGLDQTVKAAVRNVAEQSDLGSWVESFYVAVPYHDVVLLRVTEL